MSNGRTVRRRCEQCRKWFPLNRDAQKFCSTKCKTRWHNERRTLAAKHYESCPLAKKERGET